jgi:hypothetical protein
VSKPTSRAAIIAVISVFVIASIVLAVVVSWIFRKPQNATPVRSAVYVVDDVKSTVQNRRTRWFVECEDSAAPQDDSRERHVWISEAQRKVLLKGDPCPLGEGVKQR